MTVFPVIKCIPIFLYLHRAFFKVVETAHILVVFRRVLSANVLLAVMTDFFEGQTSLLSETLRDARKTSNRSLLFAFDQLVQRFQHAAVALDVYRVWLASNYFLLSRF